MVDGTIARKTKSVSELGTRLDTVADSVFVAVCFVKILPLMQLPTWLWTWIVIIAIIKIGNVVWGLISNKKLVSIHTILNKVTGFILFLLPLTFRFIEPIYSSVVVCFMATLSAINEVYYTNFVYNLIEKLTLVGYNFSVCIANLNVALSECRIELDSL